MASDRDSSGAAAASTTIPDGLAANGTAAGSGQPRSQHQCQRQLPSVCLELRRKLLGFLEEKPASALLRNLQSQVRISMDVIDQALQRYTLDELALSYNGGKDCLVLLILILACLPARIPSAVTASPVTLASSAKAPEAAAVAAATTANDPTATSVPAPPSSLPAPSSTPPSATPPYLFQAIYIVPPDPFPEVDEFVATSTSEYHLDLSRYALPMRPALVAYLGEHQSVQAIFLGTRRTDPHSEFLEHFAPTDGDWPRFMRVNPVIDWHYAEIWAFIRHLDIPFCSLYNKGFTSLGGTTDTRPNPALATDSKASSFRPAYELMVDDEERLGRGR